MSSGTDSIRPLPPDVAKQIQSSTALPSLNCVIVGLVKNSLDAGARRLDVEVDYGRGSCNVEDDGSGIPPSEFLEDGNLAKTYYTSKSDFKDPKQEARHVEALSKHLVGLLLAWGNPLAVRVKTVGDPKVLYIRANEGPMLRILKNPTAPPDLDIETVRNVLSQARHIEPSEWEDWIPTTARSSYVSVEGAISLKPAPSKRTQFISIGINYLDHGLGDNVLYEEVNRLFVDSRFGNDDEILDTETAMNGIQHARLKQEGFTTKQLKGCGKGIDRWPMFFLRIITKEEESTTLKGAQSTYREQELLSAIVSVMRAMIIRFLEDHHFLTRQMPRIVKHGNKNSDDHEIMSGASRRLSSPPAILANSQRPMAKERAKLATSERPRSATSSGQERCSKRPGRFAAVHGLLADTELPKFSSCQTQYSAGAFDSWSRIKTGSRQSLSELLNQETLAKIIRKEAHVQNLNENNMAAPSQKVSSKLCTDGEDGSKQYTSGEGVVCHTQSHEGIGGTSSPDKAIVTEAASNSVSTELTGTGCNDDTVHWMNPVSKAIVTVNARTGLIVPQHSRTATRKATPLRGAKAIRGLNFSCNDITSSSSVIGTPSAIERSTWVNDILEGWENPTYSPTEEKIPQISFDGLNLDSSALLHGRHHRCSDVDIQKAFSHSSSYNQTKLSKRGLATAHVIAQVDRKFILVSMDHVQASGRSEPHTIKRNGVLILVDQHAADERIRVEKLLADLCIPIASQDQPLTRGMGYQGLGSAIRTTVLIKPIIFETTEQERKLFIDHARHFADWGILYRLHSPQPSPKPSRLEKCRVSVKTLPESIAEKCRLDPQLLIEIMRGEVWKRQGGAYTRASTDTNDGNNKAEGWLSRISSCPQGILDMLNSRSCRSAVMFNDEISVEQCQNLIQRLADCAFPFQCAHGRPSMIPLVDMTADSALIGPGMNAFGVRRVAAAGTCINGDGGMNDEGGFCEAWRGWKGARKRGSSDDS
ncbi:hypothetical protein G7Y79_00024g056690 [Physcia stellaris]|nr:hypothetical protein G7Y79_00024g056690 [Physcia stellaris]